MSAEDVLVLKKEGGKKLTVKSYGLDVVLTVWRKNDGVLVPLVLNRMEAKRLQLMLADAILEARTAGFGGCAILPEENAL